MRIPCLGCVHRFGRADGVVQGQGTPPGLWEGCGSSVEAGRNPLTPSGKTQRWCLPVPQSQREFWQALLPSGRCCPISKQISFSYGLGAFQGAAFVLGPRVSGSACKPFKSGIFISHSPMVLLGSSISPIDFQSQTFWRLISSMKVSGTGCLVWDANSSLPREKLHICDLPPDCGLPLYFVYRENESYSQSPNPEIVTDDMEWVFFQSFLCTYHNVNKIAFMQMALHLTYCFAIS